MNIIVLFILLCGVFAARGSIIVVELDGEDPSYEKARRFAQEHSLELLSKEDTQHLPANVWAFRAEPHRTRSVVERLDASDQVKWHEVQHKRRRYTRSLSDESSSSDAWRSEQSPCPAEGWSVIRRPWAQASLPSCEAMSFVAVSSLTVDGCRQHIPHAILEGRCGAQAWKGGTGDPPSSSLGRSMAGVVALRGSRRFKAHRPVGFRAFRAWLPGCEQVFHTRRVLESY